MIDIEFDVYTYSKLTKILKERRNKKMWAKLILALSKYGKKAVEIAWKYKKQIIEWGLTIAEEIDFVLRHLPH